MRFDTISLFLICLFVGTSGALAQGANFWQATSGPPSGVGPIHDLLAVSGDRLFAATGDAKVVRTDDKGGQWQASSAGMQHLWVNVLHPSVGDWRLAGCSGQNYLSTDNGVNWSDVSPYDATVLSFVTLQGGDILAGLQGGPIYRSTDNGLSFNYEIAVPAAVNALAQDPSTGDVLAGTGGYGMWKSSNGLQTFAAINNGFSGSTVYAILISNTGDYYIGSNAGVYKSTDQGGLWTRSTPASFAIEVFSLLELSTGQIFAGTANGVLTTTNGGTTWTALSSGLPSSADVNCLEIDEDKYLYAGLESGGVYRSVLPLAPVLNVISSSVDFGQVPVGQNKQLPALVENIGRDTLIISNVYSTNSLFSASPGGGVVPPDDTTTFQVTFDATFQGPFQGYIVFEHNGRTSPDSVEVNGTGVQAILTPNRQLLAFGEVEVGKDSSQTLRITNDGNILLKISNVASSSTLVAVAPTTADIRPNEFADFTVTLSPDDVGDINETLTFSGNAAGGDKVIPVTGRGVIRLALFKSSAFALDFGRIVVNDSASQPITVSNEGNINLDIKDASTTDPHYSVFPRSALIGAGKQTVFTVKFKPTTADTFPASLVFRHNGVTTPDTIGLGGAGFVPAPRFALDSTQVRFGSVLVASTVKKPVVVTNNGDAPLVITLVASDKSSIFGVSPAKITIQPGKSEAFEISFTPNAAGPVSAGITWTHNGATSPNQLTASGFGVAQAPVFAAAPPSLDFGQVKAGASKVDSIVVRNTGNANLVISAASVATSVYEVQPVSATIVPNEARAFRVTFKPVIIGSQLDTVRFVHNAGGSPHAFPLRGIGTGARLIVPASVAFGSSAPNVPIQKPIRVENQGNIPLRISAVQSTNAAFQLQQTPPIDVPAAGSVDLTAVFTPPAEGNFSGQFFFTHDGLDGRDTVALNGVGTTAPFPVFTADPLSLDFGALLVGVFKDDTVRVTNTGSAPLTIQSVTVIPSSTPFSTTNQVVEIPAASSRDFIVRFQPTGPGDFSASLRFVSNAGNSPHDIPLQGRADEIAQTPLFRANPTSIDYGERIIAGTYDTTVTITNDGNATLTVSSIASSNPVFSVNLSTLTVPANSSRDVTVTFSPTVTALQEGTLTFTHNASGGTSMMAVQGRGKDTTTQQNGEVVVDVPEASGDGSPVLITANPPNAFLVTEGWLFYRPTGAPQYDSLPMNINQLPGQDTTLTQSIPGSAVGLRGVQYFVRLTNGAQVLFYPAVPDPATEPAFLEVLVSSFDYPLPIEKRQYRMVSAALALDSGSVNDVMEDDFGPYNPMDWRVFYYDAETAQYKEPGKVDFPNLDAGKAVWLITRLGEPMDFGSARSTFGATSYFMLLKPGWNQIANPFAFPVEWANVLFHEKTIGPFLYRDGAYLPDAVNVIQPWEGYFVFATEEFGTEIPPIEAVGVTKSAAGPWPERLEFGVRIVASSSDGSDANTFLGIVKGENISSQLLRIPKPPSPDPSFGIAIADGKYPLMKSFQYAESGAKWSIEVTNASGDEVRCALEIAGTLPPGYELYILDADRRVALGINGSEFVLPSSEPAAIRHVTILIAKREWAEANSGGISLVPTDLILYQNHPNPFSAATSIGFNIPVASHAELQIYDTRGRLVRTLLHGWMNEGRHTMEWDGKDSRGFVVSPGAYLYRLSSENAVVTRHMVVMP